MILAVFITLLALSIALVIIGIVAKDDAYSLTGYLFLFLLGTYLMTGFSGALELPNGTATNTSYSYLVDNVTINMTSEISAVTYTDYTNRTFGLFLSLGSALAFIITLFRIGKSRVGDDDED